jgi:cyanobactin maturation PatA/PatG family protease
VGDMLSYLDAHPEAASRLLWTLNLDQTPLYGIVPSGPYAHVAYERLREVLKRQHEGTSERVAIAGVVLGTVTLQSGQRVAGVIPEPSAIWDWSTTHLLTALGAHEAGPKREALGNFLQRVYFEVRNLGVAPEDRALNFAATNAFQAQRVFTSAAQSSLELDAFSVQRSPICRPTSLCYDVNLTFFNPRDRLGQARRVYRLTVDVSDVVPVTVGEVRQWSVY